MKTEDTAVSQYYSVFDSRVLSVAHAFMERMFVIDSTGSLNNQFAQL